ncbi:MAG: LysM peptidoglycan-binding domain-containing protein [Chitinophagaceae bacterium]
MKKFVLSFLFLFLSVYFASAQKGDLMVKSSDKGLYLEHKVAPKESFYSIGRLYNTHPKSIASFNKLDITKGLLIDQKVRIPLTDTNFTQQGNSGTPVYYKVGDKEGLMTVSKKNNDVKLADLRMWNNLSGDELKDGTKLIVGFLQSKEMAAVTINNKPKLAEEIVKVEEKPVVLVEEKKVVEEPVGEDKTKKEEKKEAEAEVKAEKKEEKKDSPPVVKEIRKPSIEGQGYFKSHFEQQIKTTPVSKDETVTSGIFKTTSGWQDAKYYLLIDKVAPGTIVRVINPANNKAVYAKVLGEMAGIRQNEGYSIRISNAAASALAITEQDKFIVKVNY